MIPMFLIAMCFAAAGMPAVAVAFAVGAVFVGRRKSQH